MHLYAIDMTNPSVDQDFHGEKESFDRIASRMRKRPGSENRCLRCAESIWKQGRWGSEGSSLPALCAWSPGLPRISFNFIHFHSISWKMRPERRSELSEVSAGTAGELKELSLLGLLSALRTSLSRRHRAKAMQKPCKSHAKRSLSRRRMPGMLRRPNGGTPGKPCASQRLEPLWTFNRSTKVIVSTYIKYINIINES